MLRRLAVKRTVWGPVSSAVIHATISIHRPDSCRRVHRCCSGWRTLDLQWNLLNIYSTWAPLCMHGFSAAYLPSLLVPCTPHRQPGSAIARRNSSSPSFIISVWWLSLFICASQTVEHSSPGDSQIAIRGCLQDATQNLPLQGTLLAQYHFNYGVISHSVIWTLDSVAF